MELTVISTYRCNARCSMCHIWKYPSKVEEEISADTLRRLPDGFSNINITGGEPTLRTDLADLVEVLRPKTRILEISSNGLLPETLRPILQKHPDLKTRFSLEGTAETNNRVRGEKDGYRKKVEGLLRLKETGASDLGFGAVIQDDNADELLALYQLCRENGFEFATSALHNAFQFHKNDNAPYDRVRLAKAVERLIEAQLNTLSVKNWFRAYLNLGLIENILGHDRLLPCTAGTDFLFIDPWGDVYACNVWPETRMGNLATQSWDEITHGPKASEVRAKVAACRQNCWMVTTARCAMRSRLHRNLPKTRVLAWVLRNRLRVMLGRPIPFEKYIDYSKAVPTTDVPRRKYYLDDSEERMLQSKDDIHYTFLGEYFNR